MLTELLIKNLALAEDVSVTWGTGFSVLTGETGAGKSMIIGALTLLLGGRGSADQIRAGCETATIEGIFDTVDIPEVPAALEEMGLPDDEPELIVSREFSRSGKSRSRVNGRAVSVNQIKHLGSLLIDICGQHENQSLFSASKQLALVDRLGGPELWSLRQELGGLFSQLKSLTSERSQLLADSKELARRVDLLEYQLGEIRASGVVDMDEENMRQERLVLSNADRLLNESAKISELLYEAGPDGSSVADALARATHSVETLTRLDPTLSDMSSLLVTANDTLREASRTLRQYREKIDHNPLRLAQIEESLDTLSKLKRKYGDSVTDIVTYGESIERELATISNRGERLDWLDSQVARVSNSYLERSSKMTALRTETSAKVSDLLNSELRDLGMPSATLGIRVIPRVPDQATLLADEPDLPYSSTGMDVVEFLFTANAGEEPRPLSRVASGGELSRILLALKTVMGRFDDTPTMVFDEIDAGIGGKTAKAVAEKLTAISLHRQVICVTHLTQIAAMGDQHFRIHKIVSEGRTSTEICSLAPEDRLHEIARMLGSEPTEKTLGHIREMLTNAAQSKARILTREDEPQ